MIQRVQVLIDLPGRLLFDLPAAVFNRHYSLLFRPLVVLAAWAFCLAAGVLVVWQSPENLMVMIGGVAGLLIALFSLYYLEWGIIIFSFITLWVRFSLSTGTRSPLVASLLFALMLLVIWLLRLLLFEKRLGLVPSPITTLLLAFGGVALFSFLWSNSYPDPLVVMSGMWSASFNPRFATLLVVLASVGASLMLASRLHDEKWFRIIVGMFVVAGLQGGLVTVGQAHHLFSMRGVPILGDLNTFGLFRMWVVAFCMGQVLFNKGLNWRIKALMIFISGVWFYHSFFLVSEWLSGWVLILVVFAVLVTVKSPRLLLIAVVIMLFVMVLDFDRYVQMFAEEEDASGVTRLQAWNMNLLMTNGHWFLGTGPAGYAAYYMTYIPENAMATHSNYIDVLAQFGVVGLLLLVALVITALWKAVQVVRAVPRGGFLHGLAASLLAGTIGVTVAMGLGDWVIPFAYTQGIVAFGHTVWGWMFMGSVLSVEQIIKKQRKTT